MQTDLITQLPHLVHQLQDFNPSPGSWLIGSGLILLLMPRLRRVVFDTIETIIASILLVVIVLVVLGLPFAAVYLAIKGFLYVLGALGSSLAPLPVTIMGLAAGLQGPAAPVPT